MRTFIDDANEVLGLNILIVISWNKVIAHKVIQSLGFDNQENM